MFKTLFNLVIITSLLSCQTSSGTKAQQPVKGPFLWKVEKGGKHSWLFGTMHLGIKPDEVDPKVHKAFKESKAVRLEVDSAKMDFQAFSKLSTYQGKDSLKKALTQSEWDSLLKLIPIPEAKLKTMKPFTVISTLLVFWFAKSGLPEGRLDSYFESKAKELGKEVEGLETAVDQLKVISRFLDISVLKHVLNDPVKNEKEAIAEIKELANLYRSGEGRDFFSSSSYPPNFNVVEYKKSLLFDRNNNWIPGIENCIKKQTCFVAVGAAHLIGEGSVTELLKKKGYKVTRQEFTKSKK